MRGNKGCTFTHYTHIENSTNGAANTNQLNVTRLELAVRVVDLGLTDKGGPSLGFDTNSLGVIALFLVRRVGWKLLAGYARRHIRRIIASNLGSCNVGEQALSQSLSSDEAVKTVRRGGAGDKVAQRATGKANQTTGDVRCA